MRSWCGTVGVGGKFFLERGWLFGQLNIYIDQFLYVSKYILRVCRYVYPCGEEALRSMLLLL